METLGFRFLVRQLFLSVLITLSMAMSPMARADDVNHRTDTGGHIIGAVDETFIGMAIFTPAARELVIHYSAECRVFNSGMIEYDILVNNVEVSPTHDNTSILCEQSPATVGHTVYYKVPAGIHRILVRGHVVGGVGPGQIDDQSLVVEEEAP